MHQDRIAFREDTLDSNNIVSVRNCAEEKSKRNTTTTQEFKMKNSRTGEKPRLLSILTTRE